MSREESSGDWFQTYRGIAWWPLDPKPEDVSLDDIAHGLAYQCRYNGHTSQHYSVAEHSVRLASLLALHGKDAMIAGLLHDAAEAYIGDMVRPLKRSMPNFYEIESRNQAAILLGLGLSSSLIDDWEEQIRKADLIMLATERRDLMALAPRPWDSVENVVPLPEKIEPWSAAVAEDQFKQALRRLAKCK